jgi:hypothetical protein
MSIDGEPVFLTQRELVLLFGVALTLLAYRCFATWVNTGIYVLLPVLQNCTAF